MIFKPYFDIQSKKLRKLIAELLVDERHLTIIGQTASGKTTLVKSILGALRRYLVLDFNDEYEMPSIRIEKPIRKECFSFYLRLLEPSIPQAMLSLILHFEENYDEALLLRATELYDIKVVNALRLRKNSFNKIITTFRYSIPIAKLHVPVDVRVPYAAAILADRLLEEENEVLVVEEAQCFKEALSWLAEEGRKRGKKLIFITNNADSIPTGVLYNSNIIVFRNLPIIKYKLGILDRWFRPEKLRQGEFYSIIAGENVKKYKVRLW